jgi:hypothetical protein
MKTHQHGNIIVIGPSRAERMNQRMAQILASVSAHPVADFGHDPDYHTRKSRGKGKKRKQWEQGK